MRAGGLRQGLALLACCAACVAWAETGAGLVGWVPLPAASPPVQRAAADGAATAWSSSAAFALELRRPLRAADRDGVFLAASLGDARGEACLRLEIAYFGADGAELAPWGAAGDCIAAAGSAQPNAIAAEVPDAAREVAFRVSAGGAKSFDLLALQAAAVADGLQPLRRAVGDAPLRLLDRAESEIRRRAMNRSRVRWPITTASALAAMQGASQARDALPGIRILLRALGDRHSWVTTLDEQGRMNVPGGQTYTLKLPGFELLGDAARPVVRLRLTPLGSVAQGDAERYDAALTAALAEGHTRQACGYVVDLREHTGGNMWPALDGLGPLLGEREVGHFKPGPAWEVTRTGVLLGGGRPMLAPRASAWIAGLDTRPVAVLIGPRTASSGEAVGVAFAGRPDTRFFGQRSRGLATANQMVDLGEGVRLFVMNGLMLDRNRHDYPSGLPPDEASDDPAQAEQRALDWLLSNAACQARRHP